MQPHNRTRLLRTNHMMSRCFVALAVLPALLSSGGVFGQTAQGFARGSAGGSAQGSAGGSAQGSAGGSAGGSTSRSADASSGSAGTSKTTSRFRQERDGVVVEVEMQNGDITRATVDGEPLATNRIRQRGNNYEVLAEDGSVLAQFTAQSTRSATSIATDQDAVVVVGEPLAPATPVFPKVKPKALPKALPKSMIGVGLGEVDEALATHLDVNPKKATMITTVLDGMPAATAGLRRFDVIVAIGESDDASPEKLRSALGEAEPGATFKLVVQRGAKRETVSVKSAAFDADRFGSQSEAVEILEGMAGEGVDLGGMEVEGMDLEGDATFDFRGTENGDMLFFVGPDGKRHELRMPAMPALPGIQGTAVDTREIERLIERTMEQMERRMAERGMTDRAERGGEDGARREEPRSSAPRASERARDASDERMRRLEEQMERLMRELERERDERSRAKQGGA